MEWLIERILKRVNGKNLARKAYAIIRRKYLLPYVESTKNTLDDDGLSIIDAVVEALIGEVK